MTFVGEVVTRDSGGSVQFSIGIGALEHGSGVQFENVTPEPVYSVLAAAPSGAPSKSIVVVGIVKSLGPDSSVTGPIATPLAAPSNQTTETAATNRRALDERMQRLLPRSREFDHVHRDLSTEDVSS
jgi:hypothetical protein